MLQLKGNSTNVTSATNLSLAVAVRIRATNAGTVTTTAVTIKYPDGEKTV